MLQKIKAYFSDVVKIKTTPHEIALGFAVGTFVTLLPTPGFSVLIGLFLLLIYKKMSKFALLGSMVIFNPLITAPFHAFSYTFGNFLLGDAPIQVIDITFFDHFWLLTKRYLIGNIILSSSTALISYFVVKFVVAKYQKNNQ